MAAPDSMNMQERVDRLPDQLRESATFVQDLDSRQLLGCRRVVVCGMGGSAAAAALLAGVYESEVDIRVSRRYEAPRPWIDDALVIFSSYSGNTEETLSAYQKLRGKVRARMVLTSGGRLLDLALEEGLPIVRIPGGWPPRATLGWGVGALARVLERVELVKDATAHVDGAAERLRVSGDRIRMDRRDSSSQFGRVLEALGTGLPFLYASDGLTEAVALRWRAQLNENSKILCGHALLPELDHNEVVGFESASGPRPAAIIAIRDSDEPGRVSRRFEVTRELLDDRCPRWVEVRSGEGPRLVRAMELVQLGDQLSVALAEVRGVDPTPVRSIDELKRRLSS